MEGAAGKWGSRRERPVAGERQWTRHVVSGILSEMSGRYDCQVGTHVADECWVLSCGYVHLLMDGLVSFSL